MTGITLRGLYIKLLKDMRHSKYYGGLLYIHGHYLNLVYKQPKHSGRKTLICH